VDFSREFVRQSTELKYGRLKGREKVQKKEEKGHKEKEKVEETKEGPYGLSSPAATTAASAPYTIHPPSHLPTYLQQTQEWKDLVRSKNIHKKNITLT
jgi:hypothetical protein